MFLLGNINHIWVLLYRSKFMYEEKGPEKRQKKYQEYKDIWTKMTQKFTSTQWVSVELKTCLGTSRNPTYVIESEKYSNVIVSNKI